MAKTYTQLWDAFLGGEYEGADTTKSYLDQTQDFYKSIIGPTFFGEDSGFGDSHLAGYLASFDPKVMQQAEETFRSDIGDIYDAGAGDPFAWEKISRYDTVGGVDSRVQQLLESELYGQGKFLGGSTGAEYGLETSRNLEDYTTSMRGESEALTHGSLTSGASLASGTSGATLRSGETTAVAEDVLIEAYKKAKSLGTDYRAGTEGIETNLEEDLNDALTKYLNTIDAEKNRWYDSVMGNIRTFENQKWGSEDWTDEAIESRLDLGEGFENWDCGYGQKWDATEGKCVETDEYTTELAGAKFREDPACGIGEIYDESTGQCVVREDLELGKDIYGDLCPPNDPGLQFCGKCNATIYTCGDGSQVCDESECPEQDECGEWGGQGAQVQCWDGSIACTEAECPEDTRVEDCAGVLGGDAQLDECGICNGVGAQHRCLDGTMACSELECPQEAQGDGVMGCNNDNGYFWNEELQKCVWEGTTGMHLTGCNAPGAMPCGWGECCCMNGFCSEACCDDYDPYDPPHDDLIITDIIGEGTKEGGTPRGGH